MFLQPQDHICNRINRNIMEFKGWTNRAKDKQGTRELIET